ncbi:protein-L-isoaspartate(D-aspartate) O-methyltransferase [Formivibrio citricus]|uniref:Protein-L-isoaspartate O-methyltransferase n=1 Tax=Formivibrio citricus TaxID=83765 RepID=A0A1I4XCB8_9NEIS|nr:protein-L-isoaspartate(D-aspartate) O-methyltransferase [Formivibrio citricus]SFN23581.1 protein-L-isoaspartate(D-aspartate) O-methyltransferase [Formivibrio citricus]
MDEEWFARQRRCMLEDIASEAADVCEYLGKAQLDARVMEVMGRVPRHAFVPDDMLAHAYQNRPLPIGYGKTISQPFIVALMTDLLQLQPDETVLEIGSGLGYQTSILTRLARQVYSVELIEGLARQARERLVRLGYDNVEIRVGNGHLGWPEHAPYDKVIVTAAPQWIPPALVDQLKNGGRMVLPVGPSCYQQLLLICKDEKGEITTREILPVIFSALERGEPVFVGRGGEAA